jgi:hypothetical protein
MLNDITLDYTGVSTKDLERHGSFLSGWVYCSIEAYIDFSVTNGRGRVARIGGYHFYCFTDETLLRDFRPMTAMEAQSALIDLELRKSLIPAPKGKLPTRFTGGYRLADAEKCDGPDTPSLFEEFDSRHNLEEDVEKKQPAPRKIEKRGKK